MCFSRWTIGSVLHSVSSDVLNSSTPHILLEMNRRNSSLYLYSEKKMFRKFWFMSICIISKKEKCYDEQGSSHFIYRVYEKQWYWSRATLFVIWISWQGIWTHISRQSLYSPELLGNVSLYTLPRIHLTNMSYCSAINVEIGQSRKGCVQKKTQQKLERIS